MLTGSPVSVQPQRSSCHSFPGRRITLGPARPAVVVGRRDSPLGVTSGSPPRRAGRWDGGQAPESGPGSAYLPAARTPTPTHVAAVTPADSDQGAAVKTALRPQIRVSSRSGVPGSRTSSSGRSALIALSTSVWDVAQSAISCCHRPPEVLSLPRSLRSWARKPRTDLCACPVLPHYVGHAVIPGFQRLVHVAQFLRRVGGSCSISRYISRNRRSPRS